jgi:ferric-dicitrate binding protein FerR (iron transport regulator)
MTLRHARLVALATSVLLARAALGQQEAGTVAATEGTAEISHGAGFEPASPGAAVFMGDELRTGKPGQMRVVFQDDSVLNLGDDTRLTVDEQVFQPQSGLFRATLSLLRGKVRALVGEYYSRPGAEYELKTTTAVAGVRGTEFVVSFEPTTELTEVLAISGSVEVHSTRDRIARGVLITAGELTTVAPGELPQEPRQIQEPDRWRYLQGLDVVALGPVGLAVSNPVVEQRYVPEPDRAPADVSSLRARDADRGRDPSSLLGQPPQVIEKTAGGARIGF